MLNYITTGESHGKHLAAILEGMPSGLNVDLDFVHRELQARQQGYGRGGRQKIEKDHVEVIGGVLKQKTTGAPIGLLLTNNDFKIDEMPELFRPRPGHADLAGALKYAQGIRPVLERASARETAMRVAAGGFFQLLLRTFGVEIVSHVTRVGSVVLEENSAETLSAEQIRKRVSESEMMCLCPKTTKSMMEQVDAARRKKDTLGGQYEIRVKGVPIGLGSCMHFEKKLDARLAAILMGMQSVKAVEIGEGIDLGKRLGSAAHDEIFHDKKNGYYHKTNRAGGIEGGMSNGADIVARVTMKPISTLGSPLSSVNMKTKKTEKADFERSDICAVPAGSVIGRSLAAHVIADAFSEKFGGDSIPEMKRNYEGYLKQIRDA